MRCEPGLVAKHVATQTIMPIAHKKFVHEYEDIKYAASMGIELQSPKLTPGDEIRCLGSGSVSAPVSTGVLPNLKKRFAVASWHKTFKGEE